MNVKIPKGTRDFLPNEMKIRNLMFNLIRKVFEKYGGVEIDTPVFERKELLMDKYGEESKLIYDLEDQGGELLSLRYDLTIPFARYMACNSIGKIKKYQIGKVYRRDQPQKNRGRYREFYQCDFDIAGEYPIGYSEIEILQIICEILNKLNVGKYLIKINDRRFLDKIFELCSIESNKFKTICSSIDKLDKMSINDVKNEMIQKGLNEESIEKLFEYISFKGTLEELFIKLNDWKMNEFLEEYEILNRMLNIFNLNSNILIDLSLARGLDYYTGIIYETILLDESMGTIVAGGRYDNLIGTFSNKSMPCIGVSFGIERLYDILKNKEEYNSFKTNTQIYVGMIGDNQEENVLKVVQMIRERDYICEYCMKSTKFKKQIQYVLEEGISYMIIVAENEIKEGLLKIKNISKNEEDLINLEELTNYLENI